MSTKDKIDELARFELAWFLENGAAEDISHVQSYLKALFSGVYQDGAIDKMWQSKCADETPQQGELQ